MISGVSGRLVLMRLFLNVNSSLRAVNLVFIFFLAIFSGFLTRFLLAFQEIKTSLLSMPVRNFRSFLGRDSRKKKLTREWNYLTSWDCSRSHLYPSGAPNATGISANHKHRKTINIYALDSAHEKAPYKLSCSCCVAVSPVELNPLSHNISMHILLTVPHILLMVLVGKIGF